MTGNVNGFCPAQGYYTPGMAVHAVSGGTPRFRYTPAVTPCCSQPGTPRGAVYAPSPRMLGCVALPGTPSSHHESSPRAPLTDRARHLFSASHISAMMHRHFPPTAPQHSGAHVYAGAVPTAAPLSTGAACYGYFPQVGPQAASPSSGIPHMPFPPPPAAAHEPFRSAPFFPVPAAAPPPLPTAGLANFPGGAISRPPIPARGAAIASRAAAVPPMEPVYPLRRESCPMAAPPRSAFLPRGAPRGAAPDEVDSRPSPPIELSLPVGRFGRALAAAPPRAATPCCTTVVIPSPRGTPPPCGTPRSTRSLPPARFIHTIANDRGTPFPDPLPTPVFIHTGHATGSSPSHRPLWGDSPRWDSPSTTRRGTPFPRGSTPAPFPDCYRGPSPAPTAEVSHPGEHPPAILTSRRTSAAETPKEDSRRSTPAATPEPPKEAEATAALE